MDCSPPGSYVHGDSPGKNSGVGCHALLQGIYLTQGLNPQLIGKVYFQEFLHTLFCLLFITVHWIDSFVFTYKLPIFFINDKLPSS